MDNTTLQNNEAPDKSQNNALIFSRNLNRVEPILVTASTLRKKFGNSGAVSEPVRAVDELEKRCLSLLDAVSEKCMSYEYTLPTLMAGYTPLQYDTRYYVEELRKRLKSRGMRVTQHPLYNTTLCISWDTL